MSLKIQPVYCAVMNVGQSKLRMCKTKIIKHCLKGVLNIQSFETKSIKHEAAKLFFHTVSSLKNLNYC